MGKFYHISENNYLESIVVINNSYLSCEGSDLTNMRKSVLKISLKWIDRTWPKQTTCTTVPNQCWGRVLWR